MTYRVDIAKGVAKDLKSLPKRERRRLYRAIARLAENPRPPGCRKMTVPGNHDRIRVGDYRIIYRVEDEILVVLVVRVGHRKDIYRGK